MLAPWLACHSHGTTVRDRHGAGPKCYLRASDTAFAGTAGRPWTMVGASSSLQLRRPVSFALAADALPAHSMVILSPPATASSPCSCRVRDVPDFPTPLCQDIRRCSRIRYAPIVEP